MCVTREVLVTNTGGGAEPKLSDDRQWRWIGNAARSMTSRGLMAVRWLATKAAEQDEKLRVHSINAWKEAAAANSEQNEKVRHEAKKETAANALTDAPVNWEVESTVSAEWPIDQKTGKPVSEYRNPTAYKAAQKAKAIIAAVDPNGERVLATTRERLGCTFWFGVVITLGIWLLSLPWWANRTFTLTDRRVLVRRGIWWKSENSIPLRNIQDVRVSYGPLSGMVAVVSAGGTIVFPPVPVAAAREFADAYARVSAR